MENPTWYCPACFAEGREPTVEHCPVDGAQVRPWAERGARWVGQILHDKYRILQFLRAGGMAEVYAAENLNSQRVVAVKLLHPTLAANADAVERFRLEAQLVAIIGHPNVVAIEDFGPVPGGGYFMVMELLDGRTLGAAMAAGQVPPVEALRVTIQVCEGMAAAHERGVVHRDLKPDNIFLMRAPQGAPAPVKILDLGIGKLFARDSGGAGLTRMGMVMGTPEYMSPEQCMGREVGPASDVYALGAMLYEMLLGAPPFVDVSPIAVLTRHATETVVWPADRAQRRGVPPEAEAIVLRALSKNAAERHESMLDLQADLSALAARLRAEARSEGEAQAGARPPTPTGTVRPTHPGSPPRLTPSGGPSRLTPSGGPPRLSNSVATPRAGDAAPPRTPSGATAKVSVSLTRAVGSDGDVVELAPDLYWVGRRSGRTLECNAYLRVFRGSDRTRSLLIDPGPPRDFDVVSAKVASVIGSIENLDYVFLNHSDFDIVGNAVTIEHANPSVQLICSQYTWRLVQYVGLDRRRFISVESLHDAELRLGSGHVVAFVPTPYCHCRGAVAAYDRESATLFSGDLFGSLASGGKTLLSDPESWGGMDAYHQVVMPSSRALTATVARLRRLDPAPRMIAPQHGEIIAGAHLVGQAFERIERLRVGMDFLESSYRAPPLIEAANAVVSELRSALGEDKAEAVLRSFRNDGTFTDLFTFDDGGHIVDFRIDPKVAIDALCRAGLLGAPAARRTTLHAHLRAIRDGIAAVLPPS